MGRSHLSSLENPESYEVGRVPAPKSCDALRMHFPQACSSWRLTSSAVASGETHTDRVWRSCAQWKRALHNTVVNHVAEREAAPEAAVPTRYAEPPELGRPAAVLRNHLRVGEREHTCAL